jgi:seryl-tRNA synthetase
MEETDKKEDTIPVYKNSKKFLIETVKKWVEIDNKLRQVTDVAKKLRKEKKERNEEMIQIMKDHEIDNFDIKDGHIQYKKENKREPLTQKKLLTILLEHPQLNEEQVHGLNQYVFESRKITEKESVVRKILNPSS